MSWFPGNRLSRIGLNLGVFTLTLVAADALAASVDVINPGFEDISGETPINEFTFGDLNGWTLYDPDTITSDGDGPVYYVGTLTPVEPDPIGNPGVYVFFDDGAPEGQRVGIAFNYYGSGGGGEYGLEQVLSETLQPNTTYQLRVRIGNIATGTAVGGGEFSLYGFPGYRVELFAGTTLLSEDDNSLAGSIPEGEFAETVIEHTTGASVPEPPPALGIRLINLNTVDPAYPLSDLEVDFDDIRLDASPAATPVPALHARGEFVLALLLAGMGFSISRSCFADQHPAASRH